MALTLKNKLEFIDGYLPKPNVGNALPHACKKIQQYNVLWTKTPKHLWDDL